MNLTMSFLVLERFRIQGTIFPRRLRSPLERARPEKASPKISPTLTLVVRSSPTEVPPDMWFVSLAGLAGASPVGDLGDFQATTHGPAPPRYPQTAPAGELAALCQA
eukprot:411380-Pyramimonas_sp.AAC.1